MRDDTFRIRAYGESRDANDKVIATAYCEAIMQRFPEYMDPRNEDHVPVRELDSQGEFINNPALTKTNAKYGRQFKMISFRWLSKEEI